MRSSTDQPVLWQLTISHFSEKVRWALDRKRIPHRRRAPLPGLHIAVALWVTGGESATFPVLELDGEAFGDSTAAIAALERRHPESPLYPENPEQCRRALELEDFFDLELAPYTRVLPFHDLLGEPELFAQLAVEAVPEPLGRARALVGLYARTYTRLRWGAGSGEAAEEARAKIAAAFDRVEAELAAGDGEHLVGDRFSVADLAAAALFSPLVGPPGAPITADRPMPRAYAEFRDAQSERPGFRWVEETYRRHRQAELAATA
jgi:glutathione S-transferase